MCLIAKLDIKDYQIPSAVIDMFFEEDEGVVHRYDNIFGAEYWLHCWEAPPHTDEKTFPNRFILTLALRSEHIFYEDNRTGIEIKPGDIFIVNPEIKHWLTPKDKKAMYAEYSESLGFVCVQWDIRNDRRAAYNIRDIIDEIQAGFVEINDSRYRFLMQE